MWGPAVQVWHTCRTLSASTKQTNTQSKLFKLYSDLPWPAGTYRLGLGLNYWAEIRQSMGSNKWEPTLGKMALGWWSLTVMSCSIAFTAVLLFCNVTHASKPANRQPQQIHEYTMINPLPSVGETSLTLNRLANIYKFSQNFMHRNY